MGDLILERARARGRLNAGEYRAVVIEADARVSVKDFASIDEARAYADDAVSESGGHPPVAAVFDSEFEVVHRGRPYYA